MTVSGCLAVMHSDSQTDTETGCPSQCQWILKKRTHLKHGGVCAALRWLAVREGQHIHEVVQRGLWKNDAHVGNGVQQCEVRSTLSEVCVYHNWCRSCSAQNIEVKEPHSLSSRPHTALLLLQTTLTMPGSLMVFANEPMAVKHSVLTAEVARLMAVRACRHVERCLVATYVMSCVL